MFKCQFCDYCGERNSIHSHHIKPKELNGSDLPKNRVYVCPNCHQRIFIRASNFGVHSIRKENSIEIIGWLASTTGRVLQYINESGQEDFVEDKNYS